MLHLILEAEEGGVPIGVILCVVVALLAGGGLWWINRKPEPTTTATSTTTVRVEPRNTISTAVEPFHAFKQPVARPDEFPPTASIPQTNRNAAIAARQHIKEQVASGGRLKAEPTTSVEQPIRVATGPAMSATATDYLHEAEVQRSAGRPDLATKKVRELLIREPRNAAAFEMLGDLLSQSNDFAGAADAYRESARINPSSGRVCMSLAKTLENINDVTGAVAAYRAATVADPTDHRVFNNLGGLLAETGDIAGGVEAFRKALELNPNDETAKENLELAEDLLRESTASR